MDSRPALVPAGAAPEAAPRVAAPLVPDLLFPTPALRVDGEQLREGLVFAFASGVSGGLFAEALERARTGLSTWDARAFAADLFLDDFVTRCFRVRIGGRDAVVCRSHMLRLLAHPPADPEVVDFRRGVLGELAGSPDMRHELEDLYTGMLRLRSMIEGAAAGRKWDSNRRQLDVLTAAKHIFDHMAASFGSATSGLARLRQFGTEVQATEAYRSMRELLDYDEKLATLHLKIRVGADGRVRGFEILRVEENTENAFVAPALRRWLAKLELVARGYGFGDGEVMARLLDVVFEGLQDELVKLVQLMGDLELYLGVLGFRDMAREAGLEVCLPELVESADQGRSFEGLFNPLLVAHGVKAVPCDVATDRLDTTLLITGPNSGGKTRLLQSIALAQLLAQGGLFVPARSARLLAVPGLVVSLSQETRPDQSEGRLGMELMRIRALFEQLPPGAMVVLDELCSGTNPSEGEEIFELVMSVLSELRPQAFVTTHFLTFAARLEAERKIESLRFVQVELDSEQRPTYQFVAGVATTSLAYRAASRLGVTHDQLLALVTRNKQRAREAADSE